jgi:2-haloacid dehalogenase
VTTPDISSIKALTFDVFGTVVDWRGSLIKEGRRFGRSRSLRVDWGKFAEAWRAGYRPAMDRVGRGELPWMNLDAIHRMLLNDLLTEFNIAGLTEGDKDHLNRVWHRLKPWPDSVSGLKRLRKRFTIATLSNGNVALLTNMAKNAGLPWDCILSSELARHYKPDPIVYETAARLLGLEPGQVMMVAAHQEDLRAAKRVGFKAAFVARPLEHGPDRKPDLTPDPSFDFAAKDLNDLASHLQL